MHIEKTIKGEKFRFRIKALLNKKQVEVRYLMSDEPVIGDISEDFKYIILPETYLTPYISGVGNVPVKRLKINKCLARDLKEYNYENN